MVSGSLLRDEVRRVGTYRLCKSTSLHHLAKRHRSAHTFFENLRCWTFFDTLDLLLQVSPSELSALTIGDLGSDGFVNSPHTMERLVCMESSRVNRAFEDPVLLNDKRVLQNLLSAEDKYVPPACYFNCVQTDIRPFMRKMVSEWMAEVRGFTPIAYFCFFHIEKVGFYK